MSHFLERFRKKTHKNQTNKLVETLNKQQIGNYKDGRKEIVYFKKKLWREK